jgi:hypothetical protein
VGSLAYPVLAGAGHWPAAVSVGCDACVCDTSEDVHAGDGEELAGAGVGVLVGVTGQVDTSAFVDGRVAPAELASTVAGTPVTGVAPAIAEASSAVPTGLGFASAATGSAVGAHPALEAGCGAAFCDLPETGAVLPGPARPLPDVVPPVAGVLLPPPACVPSPSGALLPGVGPSPPFSEVLAWRIAWRNG